METAKVYSSQQFDLGHKIMIALAAEETKNNKLKVVSHSRLSHHVA
jgi:hypothetical protein